MKIAVITPSIRPAGLETAFNTLKQQTFTDWKWYPRLSIPGEKPDLCRQMNRALAEARKDGAQLVVFLQDHIEVMPDALERAWARFEANPMALWTFPVSQRTETDVKGDWRFSTSIDTPLKPEQWEIDFGAAPAAFFNRGIVFDEAYDDGFGWENVDLAYRISKVFPDAIFLCDPDNKACAFAHDKYEKHPFKHKPNADLWTVKKAVIDLQYGSE